VSFDLYFLERRPGGSWDDALAALEGGDEGRAFRPDEESRWVAVEAAFRSLIPGAEVFVGDDHRELSDLETGLQLSMSPGEISLSVPYWYEGAGAEQMTDTLRDVVHAVEEATGLVAFDPQANEPFLGGGDASAARTLEEVHGFARGIGEGPEAPPAKKQPFWRRLSGS